MNTHEISAPYSPKPGELKEAARLLRAGESTAAAVFAGLAWIPEREALMLAARFGIAFARAS